MNRRLFLKSLTALSAGAILLKKITLDAFASVPFLKSGDAAAKVQNYFEHNKLVPKDKQTLTIASPEKFEDQNCSTCQLATEKLAQSEKIKVAGAEVTATGYKCALFPTNAVHSTGWCKMWNKKV